MTVTHLLLLWQPAEEGEKLLERGQACSLITVTLTHTQTYIKGTHGHCIAQVSLNSFSLDEGLFVHDKHISSTTNSF